MSLIPSRNHKYNKEIPLPAALIHGQSLGAVSGMKFGLSTMSYSGCEVIAVYNALFLAGKPQPLAEIARYMERFRVLGGFWGTNFLALGHCLRHFGLHAKGVRSRKRLTAALEQGYICLYVYWTGRRFASSVHTVCVCMDASGHAVICNAYNGCGHALHSDLPALTAKRRIVGYITDSKSTFIRI